MRNILKNRKALSTVVTTLIILVVSVLLAGVVTYFAINVTSTRVQEESLNLPYQHVWYSTADQMAEAAIMITNTGGRDVVLQNIAVRGQTVPVGDYFFLLKVTTLGDLTYVHQKTGALLIKHNPRHWNGLSFGAIFCKTTFYMLRLCWLSSGLPLPFGQRCCTIRADIAG